jgi:hypothetical protein
MEKRCEEAGKIYRRGEEVRESGLLTVVDDGYGRTRAPSELALTCGVEQGSHGGRPSSISLILHASKSPVGEWKGLEM